jgi:hypothetical protein
MFTYFSNKRHVNLLKVHKVCFGTFIVLLTPVCTVISPNRWKCSTMSLVRVALPGRVVFTRFPRVTKIWVMSDVRLGDRRPARARFPTNTSRKEHIAPPSYRTCPRLSNFSSGTGNSSSANHQPPTDNPDNVERAEGAKVIDNQYHTKLHRKSPKST